MKKFVETITQYPRQSVFYGLLGTLGLLLLILGINERNWRPLKDKSTWTATSNYSSASAYRAIDRALKTSWSSYFPMTFGMFFQVKIGQPTLINGVVLKVSQEQEGQPVAWVVKTSVDGQIWQTSVIHNHFTYQSLLIITFTPIKAQYIQIMQTSVASSAFPWTIDELDILQPVVPWQFHRSTLVHIIVGILLVMIALFMQTQVYDSKGYLPFAMITGIILISWYLRVYDLNSYELSDREIRSFPIAFKQTTDVRWLQSYFQYTPTAPSWLSLFLIRWAYKIWNDYLVALRVIPAIFSVGTVLLVFRLWRTLSQGKQKVWKALFASVLFSVSGFQVVLSRRGDFAVPLLFFMLLYLLITYRFLYQQGTYGWVPLLAVLLGIGFCFDPAMRYVPVSVLLFGAIHLLGHCVRSDRSRLKNQLRRYSLYILSVLPFPVFWTFLVKKNVFNDFLAGMTQNRFASGELLRALQYCGFIGVLSWILVGIGLIGFGLVIVQRKHDEWFWYCQGLVLYGLASAEQSILALLTLLILFLVLRGIYGVLSFLDSQRAGGYTRMVSIIACTAVLLYVGGFTFNSIFFGQTALPYAAECYQEFSRAKAINSIIQQIKDDPNACNTVIMFNQPLAEFYSKIYEIPTYFTNFSEFKRFTEQGIFATTLLVPHASEGLDQTTLTPFLNQYYMQHGQSSQMTLYTLRDEFAGQPVRYYGRDLYGAIGHQIEDQQASSGIARIATRDDRPGFLTFGPFYRVCTEGHYIARFVLRSEGNTEDVVAILEVLASPHEPLARIELKGQDFVNPDAYQTFDVPFDLTLADNPAFPMKRLQFIVHFTGRAEVRFDRIELVHIR